MARDPRTPYRSGIAGGVIVMLVGIGFLLDRLDVLDISQFYRFWPMMFIVLGIVNLSNRCTWIKGTILIVMGILFQLDTLNIAHVRWGQIWPLFVIGAGLSIIWRTTQSPKIPTASGDPRDTLNELAVFGGIERRITSRSFKGGRVLALFGGVELDMRDAEMEGDEIVLDINATFGGVELTVPSHWTVASHGHGIFGGYVDSTRPRQPESVTGALPKTLLVQGTALFGGVEIKN